MKKDMNMKRYITTGLLLAAFTAGMSACDDDVAEVVTPSLEVNEKVLSFDEETTQKLTIEANGRPCRGDGAWGGDDYARPGEGGAD